VHIQAPIAASSSRNAGAINLWLLVFLGLSVYLFIPRGALVAGKSFPNLTATTVDGKAFKLSAWKGKVVLIDCWATWCPACVNDMPGVIADYGKFHAQGLEVVGISLDGNLDALAGFTASNHMPWPQICDGGVWQSPWVTTLKIDAIPKSFLVARDGTLVAVGLRRDDLDDAIAAAIAQHGHSSVIGDWRAGGIHPDTGTVVLLVALLFTGVKAAQWFLVPRCPTCRSRMLVQRDDFTGRGTARCLTCGTT
jgi:thiol-disulfide isomerase/thioredoxin